MRAAFGEIAPGLAVFRQRRRRRRQRQHRGRRPAAGFVDRQGTTRARRRDPATLIGVRARDPLVAAVHGGRANGLFDVVSRDGVKMSNSLRRSTISGWMAAVAVPTAAIEEPFRNTALVLVMAAKGGKDERDGNGR